MVHCMAERIMQRSCYTNVVKEREECLVYDKKHTGQWISWDESVSYIRNCFFHFELSYPFIEGIQIFSTAYLLVEFFFMLSGFLFAKGVLDGKYRNKSLILIIKDRIMRLWPTYIVGLIFLPIVYSLAWYEGNYFKWLLEEVILNRIWLKYLCYSQLVYHDSNI